MKILLCTLLLNLSVFDGYCQDIELTSGQWEFYVLDTILEPFPSESLYSTIKFKRGGSYVERKVYGNSSSKFKGKWEFSGSTIILDRNDEKNSRTLPKSIKISIIDENNFYSPQPDVRTVYWLFRRVK
ncbi:MAG: hypothetical protein QNK23_05145 [Crocinitomicaceae bacterium]|nr:hypothetical protein [Crocinitomicaceae bacterium]